MLFFLLPCFFHVVYLMDLKSVLPVSNGSKNNALVSVASTSSDLYSEEYTVYADSNAHAGRGGFDLDAGPAVGGTTPQCMKRCDENALCECAVYIHNQKRCYLRRDCIPSNFNKSPGHTVFMKEKEPYGYTKYINSNAHAGRGAINVDNGVTVSGVPQCIKRCDENDLCECAVYIHNPKKCYLRRDCIPSNFNRILGHTVFIKKKGYQEIEKLKKEIEELKEVIEENKEVYKNVAASFSSLGK